MKNKDLKSLITFNFKGNPKQSISLKDLENLGMEASIKFPNASNTIVDPVYLAEEIPLSLDFECKVKNALILNREEALILELALIRLLKIVDLKACDTLLNKITELGDDLREEIC